MDEEFFFPQNVQTTYRLFGMGPRHLRRVVIGLPAAVLVAYLLARMVPVLWAVLVGGVLAVAYVAGCCWPTNGDDTVLDLWLHVRQLRQTQTVFHKGEVTDSAELGRSAQTVSELVSKYAPGGDHGAGLADDLAGQGKA